MDIAIRSGYVVPIAAEPIERGTVLITGGRIAAVGPDDEVAVPAGAQTVDAAGRWVLPGFVEAHGHIGVHEEAEGWAGQDTNEMTNPDGARMRALDAINPADLGFADALAGGVTSAVIATDTSTITANDSSSSTWFALVNLLVQPEALLPIMQ